jgi:hypothetical protein
MFQQNPKDGPEVLLRDKTEEGLRVRPTIYRFNVWGIVNASKHRNASDLF